MQWEHKGIPFEITLEPQGPFFLASARAPNEGPYVRIRPFSALERTREKAVESLKEQIRLEFRKVPEPTPSEG